MRLPESKRKQIKKKGSSLPRKGEGGGALARVRQFEKQRGIKQTRPRKPEAGATEPDDTSDYEE